MFRKKTVQNSQSDVHQGGTQGGTQAALKGKIIQIIRHDDKITIQKISEMTGVSVRTLKRRINEIPEIRYVGSGYSGHWELLEGTNPKEDGNGQ
ncbi:MAG: winged helix-turn-helix domain-containing protein [Victivallales bacterium]|nr:winged helix-turn-helix domain-containing protein [Victivallales bacterium]